MSNKKDNTQKILGLTGDIVLGKRVQEGFSPRILKLLGGKTVSNLKELKSIWRKFYKEVFNIGIENYLHVPEHKKSFDFLVIIIRGLNHEMISVAETDRYQTLKYGKGLNKNIDQKQEERKTTKSYVLWIEDSVEAPKKLKNISALNIKNRDIKTMTLLEYRLLNLFYFWLTKKHLDIGATTLCSGSRSVRGSVPGAGWSLINSESFVYYYAQDFDCSSLCPREVVY